MKIVDTSPAKDPIGLSLDLLGALKGRMAVRQELEWKDVDGKSHKGYGVRYSSSMKLAS